MAYLRFKGWYKQLRSVAQGRMAEFQEKGKEVLKMYDSLTPEENEQLFNFFTTRDANPLDIKNPELRKVSVGYKDIVRNIGIYLVYYFYICLVAGTQHLSQLG